MSNEIFAVRNLCVSFRQASGERLDVLQNVSLSLQAGEMVALLGRSGSGKSSLLHCAGLLAQPNAGEIIINGKAVAPQNDSERTALRRQHIGFVYQFHNLLPEFTAAENIALAARLDGADKQTAMERAMEWLQRLELTERAQHLPSQLSGGEQQRIALARALVNKPSIVLADEPTGSLDTNTAAGIISLLTSFAKQEGVAILTATHDQNLAASADRVIEL